MRNRGIILVSAIVVGGVFVSSVMDTGIRKRLMDGLGRQSEARQSLRIGISPFQDTYLLVLARNHNWFAQEGINVELVKLDWGEVQLSLAAGAIDVGINNISSVVSAHAVAPSIVYAYGFNTFDNGFALMVRPGGSFKTVVDLEEETHDHEQAVRLAAAQLKGKTVITTSNTDMEQGVAAAARRGGLEFQHDIKIVNSNPPEGLAAFLAGAGDAYIGGVPQRAAAVRSGMLPMLTGADLGPAPINGFVTTREFIDKKKYLLLKLLRIWFKTVQYVNTNLDAASTEMADELQKAGSGNFNAQDFKDYWNNVEHYPANPDEIDRDILSPSGKNYWKARWDDCNNYFFDVVHRIPEKVEPAGVFVMYDIQKSYLETVGRD